MNEFLVNSFPNKLNTFVIRGYEMLKSSFYIDGFAKAAKATLKEIYVYYMHFSTVDLQTFFKASSNVCRLTIRYSKLDLEEDLDFKGEEYNISYLSFRACGKSHSNDWGTKKERFKYLLDAICSCSIKDSLLTLSINGCGISVGYAKELLIKNGINKVKVIEEDNNPLEE